MGDCIDVCNEIIGMLIDAGFTLNDDESHEDIFEALSQCKLVRMSDEEYNGGGTSDLYKANQGETGRK